jgi:DNA-binding CsgD family transcriptional regulator
VANDRKRVTVCAESKGFRYALGAIFADADLSLRKWPPAETRSSDVLIWHFEDRIPTRELAPVAAATPTLVVGDESYLLQAVDAGVRGFLPKGTPLDEVRDAALTIAGGGAVVPPDLLGTLLRHIVEQRREVEQFSDRLAELTERELQVFELAAAGARKGEIGQRLFISAGTARTHLQRVYRKLGIHSQAELIALGSRINARGRTMKGDV